MKFTKFMILIGGVLALVSFFVPIVGVHMQGQYGHVSAFQMIKGIESAQEVVSNAPAEANTVEAKARISDANEGLEKVKGIIWLVFAPGFLLIPLGLAGVLRKKFGRLGGTGALVLGAWATLMGALLMTAASEARVDEVGAKAGAGAGIYLLLLGGLLGLLGGLLALIKPDRGLPAA
jgi:hypothetical protein